MRDKFGGISSTLAMVLVLLLFRAAVLLRSWNY